MMSSPLFSILIANYNNGKYLEDCLNSILKQTYSNWEIVIVDDASTDGSNSVYAKYKTTNKIKILRNDRNKGVGYTKRKCIEHARGELCGFVDADDALAPDALEIMTKGHLDNPEASIVYSTHYICDTNLQPQEVADYVGQIPVGKSSLTLYRPIISHFATFKRKKYAMTDGISSIYPKAEDKDLYFKLEETGPVLFIDKPLYFYRHHSGNISRNQHLMTAYHYEMTVKFMALLRQRARFGSLIQEMPHSKHELIGGVIKVMTYKVKNGQFLVAVRLFYKLAISFPAALIRLAVVKILRLSTRTAA